MNGARRSPGLAASALAAAVASLLAAGAVPAGAASKPDLSVRSITLGTPAVAAGSKLKLTDTVRSNGAAAGKSAVGYYLSRDKRQSRADKRIGVRSIRSLKRNKQAKGSKQVRVPKSVPLGTYYVLACADSGRKVDEANERNNCRASKRMVVSGRPKPLKVGPQADGSRAAKGTIGRGGGSLSATGADGTRYTLTVPDGGLLDPADVTLTPLTGISSLPFKKGFAGGVKIDPGGRTLLKPATLTIETTRKLKASETAGFAFEGTGAQAHLSPARTEPGKATIAVYKLGGVALVTAPRASLYKFSRSRLPSGPIEQLEQVATVPRAPKGVRAAQAVPTDDLSAQLFASQISVLGLIESNLDVGVPQFVLWDALATGLQAQYPQVLAWRAALVAELRSKFEREIVLARTNCATAKDVKQVGRLLRYRSYLTTLAGAGLLDLDSKINDAVDKCLRFELDLHVVITGVNEYGEATNADVKTTVPVRMQVPGQPSTFFGSSPLELLAYSVGPVDCWTHTWNATPQNPLVVNRMSVDVAREIGLEGLPANIEVNFDPGSLDEQVTHTCDGDSSSSYTDTQHAYDGVAAQMLAADGNTLRFSGGSGGSYAAQSFTRTSEGYTGTFTFTLRHVPVL